MKNIEFIKAGAGSGKTYTLTEKLSQKITGGQVKASEVLLTTFTKAAAAEIKERARAFLLKSGLADQAKELEQAPIGTVHSVALRFIKRYWYKLGIGTAIVELDDENKTEYIKRSLSECVSDQDAAWFDNFEKMMGLSNYSKNQKQEDSPNWQKTLKKVIEQIDTFDVTDIEMSKSKSKEMIDILFPIKEKDLDKTIDLNFIKQLTTDIKNFSAARNATKSNKAAQEEEKLCKQILDSINTINVIEYPLVKQVSTMLKKIPAKQTFLKQPGKDIEVDKLANFCIKFNVSEIVGNILKEYVERMFTLAENWSSEFKNYKKENNLIDFNDMERLFIQLLEMPEVRDEMKEEVKLVMVDEFQDSNAKQIKIFDYLSEIAQQSIWVGDAKQAIYGFRGGDTAQTQAISNQFDTHNGQNGLTKSTLENSWRSVPSLVEITNGIFKNSFESVILNPEDIILNPKITEEVGKNSLFEWKAEDEITDTDEKISSLQKLAWKVKGILDGKDNDFPQGYKPSDIAILCRNNWTVSGLAAILKSIGVPIGESGENILDYAEVQLVMSILKYTLKSKNDHAMAEILHLLYEVSTEELINYRIDQTKDHLNKEDQSYNWTKYESAVNEIDRLVERIKYMSLPDMVRTIIIELDLLHQSGRWLDNQKRMDNLMSFINTATAYDDLCVTKGTGASISGFLAYLNEQEFICGGNTDENSVTVCTYHKAKGLEWKLVILNEMNNDTFEECKFMKRFLFNINVVKDKEDNYIRLIPQYLSDREKFWGTQLEDVSQCDIFRDYYEKTLHEENRLLYVGMTRAKENLVLVNDKDYEHVLWLEYICKCNTSNSTVKDDIMKVYDTNVKKVDISSDIITQQTTVQDDKYLCRDLKAKTPKTFKHVSPSKAENTDVDLTLLGEPTVETSSGKRITINANKAEMDEIGTCIHNIFAVWNPDGDRADEIQKAQNIITGNCLSAAIPDAGQIISAAEFIHGYLTKTFGPGKMLRELPFTMKKEGRVFSGEMDLVWETDKGCVLLDYKNFPGTEKLFMNKNNEEHFVGKYKPQLCLYKEALQKADKKVLSTYIYYSVIGTVVKF